MRKVQTGQVEGLTYSIRPRSLGQEAAARCVRFRELVVQRIIEREQLAQLRRQRGLHLRAEELLLILLLRLVSPAVERVQRRAIALRAIVDAAVPDVRVGHDDGAGGRSDEALGRMARA